MPGIEEEGKLGPFQLTYLLTYKSFYHYKDRSAVEEPVEVPRTQTDRINSHLLKSFLNHINNNPQFQNVAPEPTPPSSTNSSQDQNFD